MEWFTKLFGSLLVFVYHCFDRIVINGYLENLSRPDQGFPNAVANGRYRRKVVFGRNGALTARSFTGLPMTSGT